MSERLNFSLKKIVSHEVTHFLHKSNDIKILYRERESNPYGPNGRRSLSPLRLPIPPSRLLYYPHPKRNL